MSKVTITTPKGIAVYPRLATPDTKFHDLGEYKANIRVPIKEAQPLMKKLSDIYKEHTGKAPSKSDNPMWKVDVDDEGNETENIIFKLKVKNRTRKDGQLWDRRPRMFDTQNNVLKSVNPWGGTEMRVSAEVYCWIAGAKKGVSLQPLAVQIIDLVTGTGGEDAAAFGFDEEEGFVADQSTEEENPFEDDDSAEYEDEADY